MQYLHPDNKDKPFVDWRSPSYRMEGFIRWLNWRLRYGDIDHYVSNNTYRDSIGDCSPTGKSMTKEQQCWFSLLYGLAYQSEMAWVIYWHFPNFWDINLKELEKWNSETIDKQRYARDTKYNKGRIVEQVKSLQEVIGPSGSIENYFNKCLGDNENESAERCIDACMEFYKYGRMCSWLTCQTLFETAGLPIRPDTMQATDPSNWSVRSGLMYVYGRDDMIEAVQSVKFSDKDLEWIKVKEVELYKKCLESISDDDKLIFSNYLLESHLCQYKKLMLGGDFPGHNGCDETTRAVWLRERWPNVNFKPYFEGVISHHHPLVRNKLLSKALNNLCCKTGQMINMHDDYKDMPNVYSEIGLNPDWFFSHDYEETAKSKIDDYSNKIYGGSKRWW